jgi:hypothetical protein
LVRIVSDVPFTVAVAVLMRLPEPLVVGVVPPPLPYLPPPYLLPLLVWVVPPVEEAVPDPLIVLPQAAKKTTSVANTGILHQLWVLAYEVKRLLCITFSSSASGDTRNENELWNDLLIDAY